MSMFPLEVSWTAKTGFAFGALASAWIVIAAFVVAADPPLGFIVGLAPVALAMLVKSSSVRVIAVALGGMAVLGSSSDLGPNKIIYAGVIAVCALISIHRLYVHPPTYAWAFRPILWWGLAVVAVIFVSFVASPAGSNPATFGRQSIFYLLVLAGPVIGLDAGRDAKPTVVFGLVGLVGTVASVGFAADWLDRRGVTALPFGRFILSSLVLPAFAFALAIVLVFHSKSFFVRILWSVPAIVIPIAMLVTGTRTNLIIFVAIVATIGAYKHSRVPPIRLLAFAAGAGAVAAVLFPLVVAFAVSDPTFITQRIQAAVSAISGAGDQSLSFRQEQAVVASMMISESPFLGYGLGYAVPFTVDSPLLTVLRLGWVGTALMAAFLVALTRSFHIGAKTYGANPALTAWWGFLLVCAANLLFGTPLEDRGFGYAVMLVSMAVASAFSAEKREGVGQERLENMIGSRPSLTSRRAVDRQPVAAHPGENI